MLVWALFQVPRPTRWLVVPRRYAVYDGRISNLWNRKGNRTVSLFVDASPISGFPALQDFPWAEDPISACLQARELLLSERSIDETIEAYLQSVDRAGSDRIAELSQEKSTHFKWYLGGDVNYAVFLHQYRAPDDYARAQSHAASIHNHRYPFSSRVLSGALHVRMFRLESSGRVRAFAEQIVRESEATTLSHDDIHQVYAVEERTLTLVVQGPAQRSYSNVYTSDGDLLKEAFDLPHMFGELRSLFTRRGTSGSAGRPKDAF